MAGVAGVAQTCRGVEVLHGLRRRADLLLICLTQLSDNQIKGAPAVIAQLVRQVGNLNSQMLYTKQCDQMKSRGANASPWLSAAKGPGPLGLFNRTIERGGIWMALTTMDLPRVSLSGLITKILNRTSIADSHILGLGFAVLSLSPSVQQYDSGLQGRLLQRDLFYPGACRGMPRGLGRMVGYLSSVYHSPGQLPVKAGRTRIYT